MQLPSLGTGAARHANVIRLTREHLRSRPEQSRAFRRISTKLIEQRLRSDLIRDMTRAEIIGEISEFHALFLRAIFAMIEGSDSEYVHDYLEMAEITAGWPHERAAIAEARAGYGARPPDLLALVVRCLTSLDVPCPTCGRVAA